MWPLLLFSTLVLASSQVQGLIRGCYYTNWAQYRVYPATFLPENIDALLCTHYFYAFVNMEGNRLVPYEWNDDDNNGVRGMYTRFNEHIRLYNSEAKTLLTVGGWNFGVEKMSAMLATEENRREFVLSSIIYLRERNFDGLDLNFQYPGNRGSPPEDKERFTLLVKELREAFIEEVDLSGRPMLLLTCTVAATQQVIDTAYQIPNISQNVDFMNLMTYDLHGAWEIRTGHHSPLFSRPELEGSPDDKLTQDWAANYWFEGGAPKEKLVIGMASYGRCFNLFDADDNGMGAPTDGGCPPGPYTQEATMLAYYELCDFVAPEGDATRVYDLDHQIPYAYMDTSWIGYDDMASLTNKVNVLLMDADNERGGYGGWTSWEMAFDDFTGTVCNQREFPLHRALAEAVGVVFP